MNLFNKIVNIFLKVSITLVYVIVSVSHLYSSDKNDEGEGTIEHSLIAVNDTFHITIGCGNNGFGNFVMANDIIPDCINAKVQFAISPSIGILSFGPDGNFAYIARSGFSGLIRFKYRICEINNTSNFSEADVLIYVCSDFDCDEITDSLDIDDDNDGIPDETEGNGNIDTDEDGIPDSIDIDADNDGITDNIEWQDEKSYHIPSGIDANKNGWDDCYESKISVCEFAATDTDFDGIPDFLDMDSDNDSISDFVEATDINFDNIADISMKNTDYDNDGLDDIFDNVLYWRMACNSTGSNAALPDHNQNGIRDFRENKSNREEIIIHPEIFVQQADSSFLFYPNPSSGIFTIKFPFYSTEDRTQIRIFNSTGKLIYNVITKEPELILDVSDRENGLYIISISTETFNASKKILIRK